MSVYMHACLSMSVHMYTMAHMEVRGQLSGRSWSSSTCVGLEDGTQVARLGANAFTIELSFAALHVFSLLSYEALRHFSVLKKNLAVLGFKLYLFIYFNNLHFTYMGVLPK